MVIEISTKEELLKIGVDEEYPLDADYELENDIDLEGENIDPIGGFFEEQPDPAEDGLQGTFDGKGYKVYNGEIKHSDNSGVGLISLIGMNGKVKNLSTEDMNVEGATGVGGLIAYNVGEIQNCYALGEVKGSSESTGGLVGVNAGKIKDSYTIKDVTGESGVGGLVGHNDAGDIQGSYTVGSVEGVDNVGGLVGIQIDGKTQDCYSLVEAVSEQESGELNRVGGFIGRNRSNSKIKNCYAAGSVQGGNAGGFVGENNAAIIECYYDKETTGQEEAAWYDGGDSNIEGKTTAEMQSIATFSEWDIAEYENYEDETWFIVDEEDYPRLSWEYEPEDPEDPEEKDKPLFYGMGNNSFIDALRKNLERIEKELNIEF